MIRVPSDSICRQSWKEGFRLSAFIAADADPSYSTTYHSECAKILTASDLLVPAFEAMTSLLETTNTFEDIDFMFLEHKEFWYPSNPDGHFANHEHFFELINRELLIGFGFVYPRMPGSIPKPIPVDVWDGEIDGLESSVTGNGMNYVAVRVITKVQLNRLMVPGEGQEGANTIGRPSVRKKVREAFLALCDANMVDANGPLSKTYPIIRDWLANAYPDDAEQLSKLAGETIRRVITDDFKSLVANKKQ